MANIFRNEKLDKMHEKGKLKPMLNLLNNQINTKTWLGSGAEAAAFINGHQVIKVCPKKIQYFKEYKHLSADLFQIQVNKLKPFLVPINNILYEDDHIFVYSQDKCQLLKDVNYRSPFIAISFMQLIIYMLETNQLISDIGAHNLGLLNEHLVVFDYHGLHPITRNGLIRRKRWWKRPIINLTNFVSYINLEGSNFYHQYDNFLTSLDECKNNRDLKVLIKLLYECLKIMINDANLSSDQFEIIINRQNLLAKYSK